MTTRDARKMARERRKRVLTAKITAKREAAPPPVVDIPDDPLEWIEASVRWPDEHNPSVPAGRLNDIQRDYLQRRTACRVNASGDRVPGLDIIVKPRKVRMTSLVMSLGLWAMMRWPGIHVIMLLQIEKVIPEIYRRLRFALKHLPPGLPTIARNGIAKNKSFELANGSVFEIVTAGQTEDVAERQARSGTAHLVILSEWGSYANPELAWAAAKGACPPGREWVIAEGTPPETDDSWGVREYLATRDHHGSFTGAYFWPWHADSARQIPPDDPRHESMLSPAVTKSLDQADIDAEDRLALTPSQRAWRRANYCMGDARTQRQNRREYPESVEMATRTDHVRYLDESCLEMMAQSICAPRARRDIHGSWWAAVWSGSPRLVVVTTDPAGRWGRDPSAVIAIDGDTHDLIGAAHGHCYAEEMLEAIEWILEQCGCRSRDRHWLAPERNHDVGLLALLTPARGLRIWYPRKRRPDGTIGYEPTPGYVLTEHTRPELLNHLSSWAVGGGLGPRCQVRCQELWTDLDALEDGPKPQAAQGRHDDLAIAWGGAHWIADRIEARARDAQRQTAPRVSSGALVRHSRQW